MQKLSTVYMDVLLILNSLIVGNSFKYAWAHQWCNNIRMLQTTDLVVLINPFRPCQITEVCIICISCTMNWNPESEDESQWCFVYLKREILPLELHLSATKPVIAFCNVTHGLLPELNWIVNFYSMHPSPCVFFWDCVSEVMFALVEITVKALAINICTGCFRTVCDCGCTRVLVRGRVA